MLRCPIRILALLFLLAASLTIVTCKETPSNPLQNLVRTDISLYRSQWHIAAKPLQLAAETQRSKLLWHNIPGGDNAGHNVLRLVLRPAVPSVYPRSTANRTDPVPSYGAIYTYAGMTLTRNFKYLSLSVRGNLPALHLEYGWFNQDVDGNGVNNNEDLNSNGAVEESEDVGLDGCADENEPGYNSLSNPDPNGDDFYSQGHGKCPLPGHICDTGSLNFRFEDPLDSLFYEFQNGTEGNAWDLEALGIPDQEKIEPSWFSTFNVYHSYTIDLTSDSFLVDGPDLLGWRTYHIPLLDSAVADTIVTDAPGTVAEPTSFEMVRLWCESTPAQTTEDTVVIREMFLFTNNN